MKSEYYGQESVAVNEHGSGAVQLIAAPADGRIIIDYYMVSVGTSGTAKFSSATGGTSDVDLFTLHLLANAPAIQSNVRIELAYEEALELTVNQTFSALIGYHIER